jgi:hypothetical protein
MKPEWERKWNANDNYCENNYEELQKIYGGKDIVIVGKRVAFATDDYDEWCEKWDQLSSNEQREAYDTYIPKEGEVIVM